jgi:hypothetical protein
VRVVCACGTATEVPLDKLGRLDNGKCAGCRQDFALSPLQGQPGRLSALQTAIQDAIDPTVKYRIEFPLSLPHA